MHRRALILGVAAIGLLHAPCRGADRAWATASSGLFQQPARWIPAQVPGAADRALFSVAGSYMVSFAASAQNMQAVVDEGSPIWNLGGRSYTLTGDSSSIANPFGLDVSGEGASALLQVVGGTVNTHGARFDGISEGAGVGILQAGATMNVTGEALVVGDFGSAALQLQNGAVLTSDYALLAFEESSASAAIVSGAGARWSNTAGASVHPMRIGVAGDAALTVGAGGLVQTGQLIVAELDTSESAATLTGMGSSLTASDGVFVGYQGRGAIHIDSGATLSSAFGELGSAVASAGAATLDGLGAQWNIAGTLNVGFGGEGELTVSSGAHVTSGLAVLGQQGSGVGRATLSGSGTRWDAAEQIQVGQSGEGTLVVQGGAVVTSMKAGSPSGSSGVVGGLAVGNGIAEVNGVSSSWSGDGALQIGLNGEGRLDVLNGGQVAHASVNVGRYSGSLGELNMSGADSLLSTSTLAVGGGAEAAGGIGRVSVGAGAAIEVAASSTIWTEGVLTLDGGTLVSPTLAIHGSLTGGGSVVGDVINAGRVCADDPSRPLHVTADYEQDPAGLLEIEVGVGGAALLDIDGAAQLDGTLRIVVAAGFTPQPGSTFAGVTWESSTGSFANLQTGFGSEPQEFFAVKTSSAGLTLYAPLLGDANVDGAVAGDDFTIWADHFGKGGGWAEGNFNGDGIIDGADFTVWADHFGESVSIPTSVPEPNLTACLAALAALAAARKGPRLRSSLRRSADRFPGRRRS